MRQQVAAPFNVQLHRTDPRVNVKKQDRRVLSVGDVLEANLQKELVLARTQEVRL